MEEYKFENVPEWPDFGVTLDKVSGRIPVTRLESWRAFSEALDHPFFEANRSGEYAPQYVFRGQRRFDWSLSPTLGRLHPRGWVTSQIADKQALFFAKAVRGRLKDATLVDEDQLDELWSIGQHHGLSTPLLDWSHSPYVALFFAFEQDDADHEEDNPYRAIYVFDKAFLRKLEDEGIPIDVRVIEPRKDEHGRLVSQDGLFVSAPSDNTIEGAILDAMQSGPLLEASGEEEEAGVVARYICKVYVKNEDREGCLRNLRRMNVHHASLFPDLIGSSRYCNTLIAEEAIRYEVARREQIQHETQAPQTVPSTPLSDTEISLPPDADVEAILTAPPLAAHIEAGRIDLIADQLLVAFKAKKVIDWANREPTLASIRSAFRVILRRHAYPEEAREAVIAHLIDRLKQEDA